MKKLFWRLTWFALFKEWRTYEEIVQFHRIEKARDMILEGYTVLEVADSFGTTAKEIHSWFGVRYNETPHNNLNHCNAAGCPGCKEEGSEHTKGDF